MSLQLVLPAYNEAVSIAECIRKVDAYLMDLGDDYEIILGDDGSTDGTPEIVDKLALQNVRIVSRPHRGKGAILTACILDTRAQFVGFLDSDLEIDVQYLGPMLAAVRDGYDAAVASKTLDPNLARQRPFARRWATRSYNRLVQQFFGSQLTDHQAGCKLFRGSVIREVLPTLRSQGWLWDTEVLLQLLREQRRICEVPVRTTHNRVSSLGITTTSIEMLLGLLQLRWRRRGGS